MDVGAAAAVCPALGVPPPPTRRHSRMMVSLQITFESPDVAAGVSSAWAASSVERITAWAVACSFVEEVMARWVVLGSLGSGGAGHGAWKTQLGLWQQYLSLWVARHAPLQTLW